MRGRFEIQGGRPLMKTKVETGVMQLQAKQCEAPPEAESGPWADRTTPRLWLGGPRGRC